MGGAASAVAFGLPIFQSQNQHIQSIDQSNGTYTDISFVVSICDDNMCNNHNAFL